MAKTDIKEIEKTEEDYEILDNCIYINFCKFYNKKMSDYEVYETARGVWRVSYDRVQGKKNSPPKIDYVIAHVSGEIKEVYKIEQWYKIDDLERRELWVGHKPNKGRCQFVGRRASREELLSITTELANIEKAYGNPIKYN